METCDTVGCDNKPEFLDGLHNNICEDCMEMEIADSECEAEDFTDMQL